MALRQGRTDSGAMVMRGLKDMSTIWQRQHKQRIAEATHDLFLKTDRPIASSMTSETRTIQAHSHDDSDTSVE